jgi:hypothetical protein
VLCEYIQAGVIVDAYPVATLVFSTPEGMQQAALLTRGVLREVFVVQGTTDERMLLFSVLLFSFFRFLLFLVCFFFFYFLFF